MPNKECSSFISFFFFGENGKIASSVRLGPAVRSYGKKEQPKEEPQRLKQLKPQKQLKQFCHTTAIRSILDGLDESITKNL